MHMKTWKGYQKGVNLGGWFSQCDYSEDRFNNFITEDDFKELTSWGLDHLRLPVDYNLVETEDGQYKEEGFARIKRALELGHKYGFNMILGRKTEWIFWKRSSSGTLLQIMGRICKALWRIWR